MLMQVQELIKKLQTADPRAYVVVPAEDHSYSNARVMISNNLYGLYRASSGWTEDHGEVVTPESDYGKRMPIVVIR